MGLERANKMQWLRQKMHRGALEGPSPINIHPLFLRIAGMFSRQPA